MPQDPTYNFRNMITRKQKLSESTTLPRPPVNNSRLATLIQKLFNYYTGIYDEPHPASEFDGLYDQHSPPTIGKAKKLLGIRSIRRNGLWWWTAPTRVPQQALERAKKLYEEKQLKIRGGLVPARHLSRSSVQLMQDLMKDVNYCGSNIDIESGMRAAGYGRSTIMHAKRDLGIASVYCNGTWLWVQVRPQVVSWLKEQLRAGPKLLTSLCSSAPWHCEVVKLACMQPWGFVCRMTAARGYEVTDINATPQPVPTAAPEELPDESAVIDDDSEVEEWL